MKPKATRPTARLVFATFSVVLLGIAFLRGNYLLGFGCGVMFVVITASLLWIVARALILSRKSSPVRAVVVFTLALPVGFAMAFPVSVNPDLQHSIDKQATDREARAELGAVFASDPAYGDLSISTTRLKVVNITIHGSLPERFDFVRLRGRIAGECPVVNHCTLHWDVTLRKSAQQVDGLDSKLFDAGR